MSPSRKLLVLSFAAVAASAGAPCVGWAQDAPPTVEESGALSPKVLPAAIEIVPRAAFGDKVASPETKPAARNEKNEKSEKLDKLPTPPAETISKFPPAPTGTPAEREKWLSGRLDEILARPALAAINAGVMVAEMDSGRSLYGKNERALFNPASNAKLVTTAAALGLLGPEFRFKTALYGTVKNGEVQGDLYIRGSGDPSLVSEDLWRLVADLSGAGVKKVTGNIAIDDGYFDDVRVGPAFDQKNEDFAFRAPAGAVSVNYNACAIHVMPGPKDGTAPRVVVEPASPYFTIVNNAKTTNKVKTDLTINTREAEGHTEIVIAGNIKRATGEVMEHRRVVHPDLYVGWSVHELLVKRGIKVGGQVVHGTVPAQGARQLAYHLSPPLGVIVRDVNKTSNNFMAEQLLKTLGAEKVGKPGTWPKGVQAVSSFLETIGIAPSAYKLTNGSGLYDADRLAPVQLVELLRHAYRDFRFAADFVGSLAVAGTDGTIGHRMEGSPAERFVRAKTGTLNGVSCLSGYAGAPGRVPLVFSILMNNVGETATGDARKAQDAIAEALVTFLEAK